MNFFQEMLLHQELLFANIHELKKITFTKTAVMEKVLS